MTIPDIHFVFFSGPKLCTCSTIQLTFDLSLFIAAHAHAQCFLANKHDLKFLTLAPAPELSGHAWGDALCFDGPTKIIGEQQNGD